MDIVGGSVGMDYNPETLDTLFGYLDIGFEYVDAYPDPTGNAFLYTWNFWLGNGWDNSKVECLLTVKDSREFANVDWDGDGQSELAVRTRWEEKPYASAMSSRLFSLSRTSFRAKASLLPRR